MGDEPTDDDPGWPSLGRILLALVPGYVHTLGRGVGDQLVTLRSVFLSFSLSLVAFGVVLPLVDHPHRATHVMPWLAFLAAAAAWTVVGIRLVVKPLDCSSDSQLALTYRNRFFITIAFSESVALFGFVFAFIGAPAWIYHVGGAFALVRMWTVDPPTPERLRRHQAALAASGCERSLVAALRGTPPRP